MGLSRKRTQLLAYFAGLFDGEGTVGIYRSNHGVLNLRVRIEMTDPAALGLLWREYPEGILSTHQLSKLGVHRPYNFVLNGLKAYRFLTDIKPFVLIKWPQVKVALSYLVHKRREWKKHEAHCARCERFATILKELKLPDPKGLNTVNAMLEHELRQYRGKREDVERDVAAISERIKSLLEPVETRHSLPQGVEAISDPEQEIVH